MEEFEKLNFTEVCVAFVYWLLHIERDWNETSTVQGPGILQWLYLSQTIVNIHT